MEQNKPFFSICIPQYNRTSFLLLTCESLNAQTFRDFEICISDDCSTDGKENKLISYLDKTDMTYRYKKNEKNLKYDGNLRSSIDMAKGEFCFLLNNDDCLKSNKVLEKMSVVIKKHTAIGAVVTNYEDYETGHRYDRVKVTQAAGAGPEVAATSFRNVSFASGIVLNREDCLRFKTEKWDGSEMYQMYLFSRIIASGKTLLNISDTAIQVGIKIKGEEVDSYANRKKEKFSHIREINLPMAQIGRLVADAIDPYVFGKDKKRIFEKVIMQLYLFTYPFWFFDYRRVQSWMYSLGLCLGLRPRKVFFGLEIGLLRSIRLCLVYAMVSFAGLTIPVTVFEWARKYLYRIAKRI